MTGKTLATAVLSSVATLLAVWAAHGAALPERTLLENAKVRVSELTSAPGAERERGKRATDQVIVFLDDCQYERVDPVTGVKTIRRRKAGEVIWHSKNEDAPQLTNTGSAPYRQILIELK
jgi:hypothetical protein